MTKKNWLLVATAIVLMAVYVVFFTNWFRPQTVGVFHTVRHVHSRVTRWGANPDLMFGIDRRLRLTEIKLLPLKEFESNPKVLPLWHLVSDSNSVPVKSFFYGQFIRGLKPSVPGSHAQPLDTNVTYRLIIRAGKIRGEHDFMLK
jgi:hypothetical protein